ncbi:MAG: signal peptidase I [Anaerolineales bacterium]|nr:signal peptidase I [Anaerolineales bacterium]
MTQLDPSLAASLLRQALQQGQQPDVTVTSSSMSPLLQPGDQVRLEAVTQTALQPGDIITFMSQGLINTHRYWGVLHENGPERHLQTRGDRSLTFDQPVPASNLIGRVILKRHRGRVLSFQSGPGKWLNQHLAAVARLEGRWARPAAAAPRLTPVSLVPRLLHRSLLIWRTLLVTLITIRLPFDAPEQSPTAGA